jgi:hypothetical protein
MNINDFFKGIIPEKQTQQGVNLVDPENNKIINEAIVLDELGGNRKALLVFYNRVGLYGARDGILNECAATDIKIASLDCKDAAKIAAVLAIAKESDSEDFKVYRNAVLAMKGALDSMFAKYGEQADARVAEQRKEVMDNPNIVNAIIATKENNPA